MADGNIFGFRVSGEDADTLPAGTGTGARPLHGPEPSDVPVARYAHELPAAAGVDCSDCFVTDYSLLNKNMIFPICLLLYRQLIRRWLRDGQLSPLFL